MKLLSSVNPRVKKFLTIFPNWSKDTHMCRMLEKYMDLDIDLPGFLVPI